MPAGAVEWTPPVRAAGSFVEFSGTVEGRLSALMRVDSPAGAQPEDMPALGAVEFCLPKQMLHLANQATIE